MKSTRFIIYISSLVILSCAHKPVENTNRQCDWSQDIQSKEPKESPYLFSIKKNQSSLNFIAASHGEESTNKKTFNLIRNQLSTFKPARVIVEGLETNEGISPEKYLQEISSGNRRLSEPAFLATEAHKLGIEFLGGEISDKELLQYLTTKGYSLKDLAGFYILRSWVHSNQDLDHEIKPKIWPIDGQFKNTDEFKLWFLTMTTQSLPLERDSKWTRPFQGRSDRLQDLANQLTWARDRHLAKVIQQSLDDKGKILVVYGAGHAAPQRCFLN